MNNTYNVGDYMTAYTGKHTRPTYKRGDTVGGMSIVVKDRVSGIPVIPATARSKLLRLGREVYSFTVDIDDDTGEVFISSIPADVTATLAVGNYSYDVEYTLVDGRVVTYLEGSLVIEGDFTYDVSK